MYEDIKKLYEDVVPPQATTKKSAVQYYRPYKAIVIPYDVDKERQEFTAYSLQERKECFVRVVIPELNFLVVKARFLVPLDKDRVEQSNTNTHTEPYIGQYVIVIAYNDEYWIAIPHEEHSKSLNISIDESVNVTSEQVIVKPSFAKDKQVTSQYIAVSQDNITDINGYILNVVTDADTVEYGFTRQRLFYGLLLPYEKQLRHYKSFNSAKLNLTFESLVKNTFEKEQVAEYNVPVSYIRPVIITNTNDILYFQSDLFFADELLLEPRNSKRRQKLTKVLSDFEQKTGHKLGSLYDVQALLFDRLSANQRHLLMKEQGISQVYVAYPASTISNQTSILLTNVQHRTYNNKLPVVRHNKLWTTDVNSIVGNRFIKVRDVASMIKTNTTLSALNIEQFDTLLTKPLLSVYPEWTCQQPYLFAETVSQAYSVYGERGDNRREQVISRLSYYAGYFDSDDCKEQSGNYRLVEQNVNLLIRQYVQPRKFLTHKGIQTYAVFENMQNRKRDAYLCYTGALSEHNEVDKFPFKDNGFVFSFGHQILETDSPNLKEKTIHKSNLDVWYLQKRIGFIADYSCKECNDICDYSGKRTTSYEATLDYWKFNTYDDITLCTEKKRVDQGAYMHIIKGTSFLIGQHRITGKEKYWTIIKGQKDMVIVDAYRFHNNKPASATITLDAGKEVILHVIDTANNESQIVLKPGYVKVIAKSRRSVSIELDAQRNRVVLSTDKGSVLIDDRHISLKHSSRIDIDAPNVYIGPNTITNQLRANIISGSIPACKCGSPAGASPSGKHVSPKTSDPVEHTSPVKESVDAVINPEAL